ncbi:MAG: SIR2 family protein [Actinobacteria bacterium]|nr:SIR2 family protein [Actinomycetota bacterium]
MTFTNELGTKLSTRSRHVCTFLGAGISKACGLPDVATLEQDVVGGLEGDEQEALQAQLEDRNLEQTLSRLRRISSLVSGDERVDGLTGTDAAQLDNNICRLIVGRLAVDQANLAPALQFVSWAGRTSYSRPVEIFTVNYDLLLETSLERLGIPYFDGFVGYLTGRFRTDLVEAKPTDEEAWLPRFVARLWKLHGSVNWRWDSEHSSTVSRLGTTVSEGEPAAIYPSDAKYEESRRVPFVVLQDRFRRALQEPETLLLVCGYSWSDAHLNEMIFEAARRHPRSEIISFCYSTIPEELANEAVATPNLQVVAQKEAIIGAIRGAWQEPTEAPPETVWMNTTRGAPSGTPANARSGRLNPGRCGPSPTMYS